MSASRREFLLGLAASGVIAKFPASGYANPLPGALYPPVDLSHFDKPIHHGDANIRIGYASITWSGHDIQAIEDISSVGYPGIQLRANALKEFPDPRALRDLLATHKLAFVALSSGTAPLDPALRQSTIETHVQNARYLHQAGGKYLQVIGAFTKSHIYTASEYQYEGQLLTEIAKRVADFGIQTGFHNHMGSIGQTPEALDAIMNAADPRYVKLELDTGHYVQGGGDPAAAIHKYDKRLLFLHLKDVRDASTKSGYEFTELGNGRVDFSAIFTALYAIHFRGWGIVELDGERPGSAKTPKESAAISKSYLEKKLGVRV
ncbi:MAG TPA: TIM barrel protein [Acidobacteriaceae bacterium]|jgi:inosose dehydratase|nr:TIM barrel protein [Acidobacteriaceae bacterium]